MKNEKNVNSELGSMEISDDDLEQLSGGVNILGNCGVDEGAVRRKIESKTNMDEGIISGKINTTMLA